MDSSLRRLSSLAQGAGIGLVGRFGGRLLNVVQTLIAARVLGPDLFGVYMLGWTTFRLVELIAPLGFDYGIIKFVHFPMLPNEDDVFARFLIWSLALILLLSSIFIGLGYVFSPWLADMIFKKPELTIVFRLYTFAIPLTGILGLFSAASRLTHDMRYSFATQDLGQPLGSVILICGFYFLGLNLKLVVLSDVLSYLFSVMLACYFLWKLFPFAFHLDGSYLFPTREYLEFSIIASLSVLLSTFAFWVDRLFVGYFLPSEEMGIYQAALQVSVVFAVILTALNRILVPLFASVYHERNFEALEELFRVATKWAVYLGLPVAVFILLNSNVVLEILYGTPYSVGAGVLIVLLASQLVNLFTGAVGPLLLMGGYQKILSILSAGVLVINTVLCVILIPIFGIMGGALSNAFAVAFFYLLLLFLVKRKIGIWPYDRRYFKGLLATCAAVIPVLAIKEWLPTPPVIGILLQIIVLSFLYVLVLKLLQFDPEDHILIDFFRRLIRLQPVSEGRSG